MSPSIFELTYLKFEFGEVVCLQSQYPFLHKYNQNLSSGCLNHFWVWCRGVSLISKGSTIWEAVVLDLSTMSMSVFEYIYSKFEFGEVDYLQCLCQFLQALLAEQHLPVYRCSVCGVWCVMWDNFLSSDWSKIGVPRLGSHWGGWAWRRQNICCSRKTRRITEGWAELCHTRT